jgi:hypothetical protein
MIQFLFHDGTRTHHAHISPEHVDKLRELVKAALMNDPYIPFEVESTASRLCYFY